jgi:uncharacterized protein YgbK (DUF1537 family)
MKTSQTQNVNDQSKMLVVADDFTGANDTGVQFSRKNLKTVSITGSTFIKENLKTSDVLVINTDSRFDDKETAYRKVYETGQLVRNENIKYIYKKLDSTMRGNIGAEISALMDSLDIAHTFMVPALPEYGRTTLNGRVYINDVLLEETEFARDPRNPVRESLIPKIISGQTDKTTAVIIHDYVAEGRQTLVWKLYHHINAGTRIIIFDARNEADIDLIASVISEVSVKVLYAGCSGLAKYLSKYLVLGKERKSSVVIAGSVSEMTRRQVDFAAHYLPVRLEDIDYISVLSSERPDEKKRLIDAVTACVAAGENIIIRSAPTRAVVAKSHEAGKELGLEGDQVSEIISTFLGEIAADIIRSDNIKGILLTGGDTAVKALRELNAPGVILEGEVVHGIPFGHFAGGKYRDIIIVTKAGGFGNEDAIFRALNFLGNY